MPQVTLATYYGNVVGLVFAGISSSRLLMSRYPFAAGAVSSLAWLKPQVGVPAAVLVALFLSPARARTLAGFGVATGCMLALTGLTTGWPTLALWLAGLIGW